MGDRISIQFVKGDDKSVVLFSHWGGQSFYNEAMSYVRKLKAENKENRQGWPIDRREPETVMVDFIRHITQGMDRVKHDYYLGVDESDGDNSDNGHFIINLE